MFEGNYLFGAAELPSSTTISSSVPLPEGVTIILSSNTKTERRVVKIRSSEATIIGRASKSELKNLQALPSNALFDCPVISRVHAELRTSPGDKHVDITDCSSLHGTTVNGRRLAPGVPFNLRHGDVIKLGERVTRGEDTIDGVSLTYYCFDNPSSSQNLSTDPLNRGFSVPSPSEIDGSDLASDSESIHSDHDIVDDQDEDDDDDDDDDEYSAQTTPEQPVQVKLVTGTKQAPIDLDPFPVSRPSVTFHADDADDDDEEDQEVEVVIVPESVPMGVSVPREDNDALNDSLLNHTATSQAPVKNNVLDTYKEIVDESIDDADNLSDSSENADIDHQPPYRDFHYSSANRPVSPELGDESIAHARAPSSVNNSFYDTPFQTARYDPIRGSQSQPEDPPRRANDFGVPYKAPNSMYTYGSFGYSSVAPSTTDFHTSSRWDIPPARREPFHMDPMPMNSFGPPPIFPSYGTDPNFSRPTMPPPPPPPPPPAQPIGMEAACCSSFPATESFVTGATTAAKGKISIPDIVDESPEQKMHNARSTVDPKPSNAAGLKRKVVEESSEEISQTSPPEAKRQKSATESIMPKPRSQRSRSSRPRGIIRRLVAHTASAALGGVVGGISMVAFLNSDMSQKVIEWLA